MNILTEFNVVLFYIKFLIQTYEFEDALEELKNIPNSSLKLLCQTNALQHLGLDIEVEKLLSKELPKCNHDENYYIILRNTAHFYDYDTARKNLLLALNYFKNNRHTSFAVATIQNNLSVIDIWKEKYEEADQFLKSAIKTLEQLNSNEVFEPYCNKSILYLMWQKYSVAIKYAYDALKHCPKTLTLDIIMLNINIKIFNISKFLMSFFHNLFACFFLINLYHIFFSKSLDW